MAMVVAFLRRILNIVFPSFCSYCQSPTKNSGIPHFCSICWEEFSLIRGPICPVCGRPFDSPQSLIHSPEHRCQACRSSPPAFDQALSIGYFEGSLREAIHQFKYRPCRALGKPLGLWMAAGITILSDIDVVMPVPLHRSRLKQRGFNQALLLAHPMSKRCGASLSCDNLYRTRPTRPQVELTVAERIKNVAGAFALRQSLEVENRHVLLIDDVFTTGATLHECSVVLKNGGAAQVTAVTLARAV